MDEKKNHIKKARIGESRNQRKWETDVCCTTCFEQVKRSSS